MPDQNGLTHWLYTPTVKPVAGRTYWLVVGVHGALVTYREQAGVGDHRHNGNETREQLALRNRTGEGFLRAHRTPPILPERGSFIVAGHVKTARFEVILDSVDRVDRVDYDLPAGHPLHFTFP